MKNLRSKNSLPNRQQRKKPREKHRCENLPIFDAVTKSGLKDLRKTTVICSQSETVRIAAKNFTPTVQSIYSAARSARTRQRRSALQKDGLRKRAITCLSRETVYCAVRRFGRATDRNAYARPNVKHKTAEKNSLLTTTGKRKIQSRRIRL